MSDMMTLYFILQLLQLTQRGDANTETQWVTFLLKITSLFIKVRQTIVPNIYNQFLLKKRLNTLALPYPARHKTPNDIFSTETSNNTFVSKKNKTIMMNKKYKT